MSAPGAGGLVDSRDFVNLRSWQLVKNGNIIEDEDTVNYEKESTKDSPSKTPEQFVHQMRRSASEINMVENQLQGSTMDESVYLLSRSLGAKAFIDDEFNSSVPEMFNSKSTTDDTDEFVDANESQGAQSTNDSSHRSEEMEQIKDIANDLCDKMYIISGVSIKYDRMPTVTKYTR